MSALYITFSDSDKPSNLPFSCLAKTETLRSYNEGAGIHPLAKKRHDLYQQKKAVTMPYPDRKVRRTDRIPPKPKGADKEMQDLRRLLSLITPPVSTHQVTVLGPSKANKPQKPLSLNESSRKTMRYIDTEATELENFSVTYRNQRCFSNHLHHKLFLDIFTCIVRNRLSQSEWMENSSPENILRILICLRLLIREPLYQKVFHELRGFEHLSTYMSEVSKQYLECGEQTLATEQLVTMTYMFQKLSAVEEQRQRVIECGAHKTLVRLLSTRDSSVLLGSLLALTTLAESPECKESIGELSVVESLLVILQEYDMLSKRISAELLRLLCPVRQVREQVRACDGVPVLLSLLHADHLKLLWSVVWVLVQLCQDPDTSSEIRAWGGVQQLLRILHTERAYVSDRSSIDTLSSANASGRVQRQHVSGDVSLQDKLEDTMSLQAACCAAITELVLDDTTAHHVVQENGVYIIGKLVLPQSSHTGPKAKSLQCYAFRTLRFLFSMERNRHLFKRVFCTELFEMFIDVGHYVRDITAYEALQEKVSLLSDEELAGLREGIETVNQNRSPLKLINGYAILDHLGSGAFGSVYKVRKQNGQNFLALKEVNLHNPAFGKDKKARDSSVERIVSELTIIKEQMAHPNIVRYFKTFLECDRLYIVMELIEGATLADHFNSLREKQQQFTEERVWNIFVQVCLALRYLHKEKRIIHRDLTPNNIMLGERDKVTITDFGLAKQKQENSKLMSVVGTILYSCPEIVKSEPYGEKADIWAIGCILYQMITLRPPFYSTNMLSLATKIVEAVYDPVEDGNFSQRVTDMIRWCLTPEAEKRPDIVEVGSKISDIMMKFMDSLCTSQNALERRAERDRKRAQKYFLESNRVRLTSSVTVQGMGMREHEAALPESTASHSSKAIPTGRTDGDVEFDDDPDSLETITSASAQPNQCNKLRSAKNIVNCSVKCEQNLACGDFQRPKTRPASAGICVSQKKVRQIDDPVQRLLGLLHKILFICQLPPAPHQDVRRRAIERFKKALFHYGSSPSHLKVELNKVLQGSVDQVESASSSREWWSLLHSFGGDLRPAENHGDSGYSALQEGITYEQMQGMIEEVLEEHGYYDSSLARKEQDASGGHSRPPTS